MNFPEPFSIIIVIIIIIIVVVVVIIIIIITVIVIVIIILLLQLLLLLLSLPLSLYYCLMIIILLFFKFKAKQVGTTQLDEDGLFELVKTRPGKKISYEPPSVEKKPKKRAKAEVVESTETLSQGKDQSELESSQMSQQSTSSPATQTPSGSPSRKGLIYSFECF